MLRKDYIGIIFPYSLLTTSKVVGSLHKHQMLEHNVHLVTSIVAMDFRISVCCELLA